MGSSSVGLEGATVCTQCVAGRFANVTGAEACTACVAGTFAASLGSSGCLPCLPGYLAPEAGSAACVLDTTPVPQTFTRLNVTQLAVWVPPSVSVTVTPLSASGCAVPAGYRLRESFDLVGAFATPAELRFLSNGTVYACPIGRDLYVCVDGVWQRSYAYGCGSNATRPGVCSRDTWLSAQVCHNTEFGVLDPIPNADCERLPRLCQNCTEHMRGCNCEYDDTDAYYSDSDAVAWTVVYITLFVVMTLHRVSLEGWEWCHVGTLGAEDVEMYDSRERVPMITASASEFAKRGRLMDVVLAAAYAVVFVAAFLVRVWGTGVNTWSSKTRSAADYRVMLTTASSFFVLVHPARVFVLLMARSRCDVCASVFMVMAETALMAWALFAFLEPVYQTYDDKPATLWMAYTSVASMALLVDFVMSIVASLRAGLRGCAAQCVNFTLRVPLAVATVVLWVCVSLRYPCE